jgi:tetratricopeptide (TPR) repeat protein
MAPLEEVMKPPAVGPGGMSNREVEEWAENVDEVTDQIRSIIDGTITDFEGFDKKLELKERAKQIRQEEIKARREKFFLNGIEGKGEGTKYKWWCKRCFVEYLIDLPENTCTRCQQTDNMMTQADRRAELMDKVGDFKETKARHQWRKDKWNRWKKSQALLKRSRNINYKAWEYWEPNTDTEDEGEPICPRDNPEFLAMEADMKDRRKKQSEKAKTAEKCRQRGNQCMKEGDYVGAIEEYEEGLEYNRSSKALWTNRALAELKIFRWHDAINSCNKVIEYSEIFEEGFTRSADACFKAFTRRAMALRALHKWDQALEDLEDSLKLFPRDKDARDLLEKTKLACQEAKEAQQLQEGKENGKPDASETAAAEPPSGPVRVEIEESEDEEEEATANLLGASAQAGSVTGLTKQAFADLLKGLKASEAQRVLFCTRKGGDSTTEKKPQEDKWIARKIELKVEEVSEPSRLDILLKDLERCHILWKKRKPDASSKILLQDDEPEAKEADAYSGRQLHVCWPRSRCLPPAATTIAL